MPKEVTAEVILRTRTGTSILDLPQGSTPGDIESYRVEEDVIDKARRTLNGEGIDVVQVGSVSLSIRADKATFERVFKTSLRASGGETPEGVGGMQKAPTYEAFSPIQVPKEWSEFMAQVVLPTGTTFYP